MFETWIITRDRIVSYQSQRHSKDKLFMGKRSNQEQMLVSETGRESIGYLDDYTIRGLLMLQLAELLISASKSVEEGGAGKSWSRRRTLCVLLRSGGVVRWTATVTVLRHVLRGQLCPLGDKEDVARDAPRPQILPLWRRPIVKTGNRTYY